MPSETDIVVASDAASRTSERARQINVLGGLAYWVMLCFFTCICPDRANIAGVLPRLGLWIVFAQILRR
jgi:hypothetical protein